MATTKETTVISEWVQYLSSGFAALGGVILAYWLQQRANRAAYRRTQENLALDLVSTMMTVLDEHRSAMWALRDKYHSTSEQHTRSGLLTGLLARWVLKNKHYVAIGQARCEELARTHQTRKAISGPLFRLHVLDLSLGAAAEEAADATFAMHHSTDLKDLEVRRLAARDATRRFRAKSVERFQTAGISLVLPHDKHRMSKPH
jgi:hypothetical protein